MNKSFVRLGAVGALILGCGALPFAALAGPCTNDIAQLGKALSQTSDLGPPTTGALAGSGPGSIKPQTGANDQASTAGTSATGKLGGTGGTKEMDAATNQVATSAEDVRRQQKGEPTMAATGAANQSAKSVETQPGAATATTGDRVSQAKMELEQARALDAKSDASCKDAVRRTQDLMKAG